MVVAVAMIRFPFGVFEKPAYAETRSRFSAEVGVKPEMDRGSEVNDGRRGGYPCLHKRGFASAEDRGEPRWPPKGILYFTGDSPPCFSEIWPEGLHACARF